MVVLGTVFQFILEFSCLALNKSIIHDMSFRASNKSRVFNTKTQEWEQGLCSKLFEWEFTHEILFKKILDCKIMIFDC